MKFTEALLEQAFIHLLGGQGYPYLQSKRCAQWPDVYWFRAHEEHQAKDCRTTRDGTDKN